METVSISEHEFETSKFSRKYTAYFNQRMPVDTSLQSIETRFALIKLANCSCLTDTLQGFSYKEMTRF